MSDELSPDQNWLNNQGISLPDEINAAYNAGLSPLFFGRNNIKMAAETSILDIGRGHSGHLWPSTAQGDSWTGWSYYLYFNNSYVAPSQRNSRAGAYSLRCLVSTNNRLMNKEEISLVSDVVTADGETNMGISLPMATNATHNSALSPFFLNRSGMLQDILIVSRGTEYNSWSVSSYDPTFAGRFVAGGNVRPSYALYRRYGMSLRCLVSTNNR